MNNHKRFILIWLIFLIAIIPNVANGETTQEKGLKIATAMERRDDGWVGQTAEVEFVINAEKRRGAIYKFRTQWIEVPDDGDKGIIIYDFPADMRGVVSLAHLHRFVPNDMWIFIPRNKRVKRFSSQKKNSSFLGSEFTSEDLNRGEVEKYTYDWVKDEEYEELSCSVKTAILLRRFAASSSGFGSILIPSRRSSRLSQSIRREGRFAAYAAV